MPPKNGLSIPILRVPNILSNYAPVYGLCTSRALQSVYNENVQNIQRDLKELQERNIMIGEGAICNRRYRLNEVNQQSLSI